MKSIYKVYKCIKCKNEMILLSDEIEQSINHGRYLSCAYCNSKNVYKEKETDSLKECMNSSSYKRVNGALRQVRRE